MNPILVFVRLCGGTATMASMRRASSLSRI
jgi:hypothetical protein